MYSWSVPVWFGLVGLAASHEIYPGKCPDFTPMDGFDWAKFSDGVWYVTQKFDTKSSCLTYQFKTDNLGFKSVEQIRQLPFKDAIGVDHEYKYTGKLYAPQESTPAKMVVRFPLNVIGSSSYVVTDTDYTTYGMVCTCQDVDLFLTYAHRISCSILQRNQEEDEGITKKLMDTIEEKYQHDFDKIDQTNCEYGKEKVWSIDVDKIVDKIGGVDDTDYFDYYAEDTEVIPTVSIDTDISDFSRAVNPAKLEAAISDISSTLEGSSATIEDLKEKVQDVI